MVIVSPLAILTPLLVVKAVPSREISISLQPTIAGLPIPRATTAA